jgi:hypothetical protein
MKVFISWSGERSRTIAEFLREWLKDVNQVCDRWMSDRDIRSGSRWLSEIASQLADARFGILCLTPEACTSPWLLFEAGAISKVVDGVFVCPYLIGMDKGDIPQGPLTQFQAKTSSSKEETLQLVCDINSAIEEARQLDQERLRKSFERYYPDLEAKLNELPPPEEEVPHRKEEDKIDEILLLVRQLNQRHDPEPFLTGARQLSPRMRIARDTLEQLLADDLGCGTGKTPPHGFLVEGGQSTDK